MKTAVVTATQSFTVPAGAGTYAPERLTMFGDFSEGASIFEGISLLCTEALASAKADVFVLPFGAGNLDAAWIPAPGVGSNIALDTVQGVAMNVVAGWAAVQIRVKSGGTAGPVILQAAGW